MIGKVPIGNGHPLALIGGPCVIESEEHLFSVGRSINEICQETDFPFILKSSFDKANRTSISSYRGPGLEVGTAILARVGERLGVPVITDIHEPAQAPIVAEAVDALQIPAFLCRQTDLLCAAAKTGLPVNVKKGQFLAPGDMVHAVEKLKECGCDQVLLTERGHSLGYNDLVVDMRSLVIMRSLGHPVVYDATHSVQQPGGLGGSSGGQRELIPPLVRAAAAVGIDALFMEIHDDPDNAKCDGPCVLNIRSLRDQLIQIKRIDNSVKGI